MAHKTKVNGTAYEISGGKTKINGTGYGIAGGRTRIGGTGYDVSFGPAIAANFADNDWATIIWACQNNAVPDTWAIGDQKAMTINGTDYLIDIIGKNHDTYSDGRGKAPLTFQLHEVYATEYPMVSSNTNSGGWGACVMRTTHLPAILALMPSEVQAAIKEVNKLTSAGNQSSTINTTADKLFLLSEIEVFGKVTYSKSGEGSQYAYYAAGNSKIKYKPFGLKSSWSTRSPKGSSSTWWCLVYTDGTTMDSNANAGNGKSFAFCF